jgi:hypothetical protein
MLSVLATAWRVVVKRAASDWLVVGAAAITILLATTLLAAGPIYADAVTLSSAQRTLADAEIEEANVEILLRIQPDDYVANNEIVTSLVPDTFGLTGGTLWSRIVSGPYELPSQPLDEFTDVAVFQARRQIEEHASIVAGSWPERADGPLRTAISAATAIELGLDVGDGFVVTNRRDRSIQERVVVAGIFELGDPTDPYWFNDALELNGVVEGTSFRTLGPFIVDLETLLASLSPFSSEVNWRVLPDFANLTVDNISELRQRAQGLEVRLNAAQEANVSFRVETRLAQLLSEIERSLLATRSGVLTLTIQLAILAFYALLLTAGLIVESRRVETGLLRSRGASRSQLLAMNGMEALLLTVPTALLAPWLAAAALRLLNSFGPLASIQLEIDPAVTRASYFLAAAAAAGSVAALTIPAHRSSRSFSEAYQERGRERSRSLIQRGGIDFALLALAGVAFWQLRRYGVQITSTVRGQLGIDPLLVAAPALGLLAGAVLALRTIPLLARLAERSASRGRTAVRALSAWQVSRRPARHSRSALLLIMAVGIGLLAAAYTTTWRQSQNDQADHQVGADIRAAPNRRLNASIPELNLQSAHEQIEGLEDSLPVVRRSSPLGRGTDIGRLVLLDAARAARVVQIREDLTDRPFGELMDVLAAGRPSLAAVALPGRPQRIGLEVAVEVAPLPEDFVRPEPVPEIRLEFVPEAKLVLQDGSGLLHRVDLGKIPTDGSVARLVAELSYPIGSGAVATPVYPLSVIDIEIRAPAPFVISREATIHVDSIVTSGDVGGDSWEPVPIDFARSNWELARTSLSPSFAEPGIGWGSRADSGITFRVNSGISTGRFPLPVSFGLRPAGTQLPEQIPIVVSQGFLELTESAVGEEIQLGTRLVSTGSMVITGALTSFPTVDPLLGEAILLDLPTVQMLNYEIGAVIAESDERWMSVGGAPVADVVESLLAEPFESRRLTDRTERSNALQSDPVALGTIGSLALGFFAATVFAAVGFAVSAVVSARERITEFALLRAVGLSPRQLAAWLFMEHGVLVLISLIFGATIGLGLAWLILPLIAITQDATSAVPDVLVVYPWRTIAGLELGVVFVLGVIIAVLAAVLRRSGLGTLLRMGED